MEIFFLAYSRLLVHLAEMRRRLPEDAFRFAVDPPLFCPRDISGMLRPGSARNCITGMRFVLDGEGATGASKIFRWKIISGSGGKFHFDTPKRPRMEGNRHRGGGTKAKAPDFYRGFLNLSPTTRQPEGCKSYHVMDGGKL